MNHIIDTCPLTKFEGGLNLLHEADDDAVIWLEYAAYCYKCSVVSLSVALKCFVCATCLGIGLYNVLVSDHFVICSQRSECFQLLHSRFRRNHFFSCEFNIVS